MQLLQARLDSLEARIAALERAMENADPKLRETYQARVYEAADKRRHARELMAELRLQQAEGWERTDLWNGLEAVFDDLGAFLDRVTHSRPPPR
jgi:BMFP domain-containing protein YqiC